jgi:ABC-2 type transport system permease protein
MIYPFSKLATSSMYGTWFYDLYLANPLTIAVLLLQRCFWIPTWAKHPDSVGFPVLPEHYFMLGWVMLAASLVVLVLAQIGFSKLENKIAERV